MAWPELDLSLGRAPHRIQKSHRRFVQKITHAYLGLGDHFHRAFFKRPQCEFGAASGQTGADHDRRWHFRHDFSNKGQAVHARHFQVRDDHVGRFLLHLHPRNQRICSRLHIDPVVGREDGLHDLADHRRVIHNQDLQILSIQTGTSFPLLISQAAW